MKGIGKEATSSFLKKQHPNSCFPCPYREKRGPIKHLDVVVLQKVQPFIYFPSCAKLEMFRSGQLYAVDNDII